MLNSFLYEVLFRSFSIVYCKLTSTKYVKAKRTLLPKIILIRQVKLFFDIKFSTFCIFQADRLIFDNTCNSYNSSEIVAPCDMVKHELQGTSCELRVTSYELKA